MAMAAKTVKKEKKKPISVKTSLNTPYTPKWSPLDSNDMHFILNLLKEKLSDTGLRKKDVVKSSRKWFSGRKLASAKESEGESAKEVKVIPRGLPEGEAKHGWTDVTVRKQLAIGINEVTRSLERNDLCLVLVCKSVRPMHMTTHLIPLSTTRAVPACQVPRLSETLSGLLGLKCVLALGVRRNAKAFSDAVEAIISRVPPLQVAWVPAQSSAQSPEDVSESDKKGCKRKLEGSSVEAAEPETSSAVLQPLKVKKIIPNPTKVRRPKKVKK